MNDTWATVLGFMAGPIIVLSVWFFWFLAVAVTGLFNYRVKEMLKGQRHRLSIGMGVEVAQRSNRNTIMINLDRNGSPNPAPIFLRRQFYWGAKKYKVDLVPVSFRALDRPDIMRDTIRLIERKGRECVFRAEGYEGKTHYYLSGFDKNEPKPLYFLAELPRKVTDVKDARQALKPPSVVEAEKQGRTVFRQGDMFAIPTKITTDEIYEQGGIIEDRQADRRFFPRRVKARKLYGTAHTASRVAVMPNGTNLAWGRLYHEPRLIGRGTRRDHRPCWLRPRRWHLVARNTVPAKKRVRRQRGFGDLSFFEHRIILQDW